MKNKKMILIIGCFVIIIGFLFLNKKSYHKEDIDQEIETLFISQYDSLFQKSDIPFHQKTYTIWENTSKELEENIMIEKIEYIGKDSQTDIMIMSVCGVYDEEMISYLDDYFENEPYCTSSYYDFSFHLDEKKNVDTSQFSKMNSTAFSKRLADDVLNNHYKMVVSYQIKIDDKWYHANTIMNVENPTVLFIPNEQYGKGNIIN